MHNLHSEEVDELLSPLTGVENIKEIAEAGADMFVTGSAIFRDPRTENAYRSTINDMRNQLKNAATGSKATNLHR